MKKVWNKIWKAHNFKLVAAFLIPAIFAMIMTHALDNDSWYVLSEGREIVRNGVYYTDVLSMHEGLSITVQNYGFAAIYYLIFNTFGAAGIYLLMLLLNFAICFLIYKICMLISGKNNNLSLLIMVATDMLLASGFVVTRAQMVSFVIFLGLIYVLELYVKTGKVKFLWWIPVLSVLQINLHASLWLMLPIVLGVYIIDSFKKPKLHLQGYRCRPLLIAGLFTVLCGLINPYGFKMVTFIFTSYGDARFHGIVAELAAFSPFRDVPSIFVFASIVGTLFLYIFGERKNIRVRYLLMLFGFLALGLNTVKGMSQLILTLFFPLALVYKNARVERVIDNKDARNALVFWGGVVTLLVFAVMCPLATSQVKDYPSEALVAAMDVIDSEVGDADSSELKVFAGYNNGGYVEYRGYKPYLDPRGEVFLKKNNGKEDILYEWADLKERKIDKTEFVQKYEFDFILAEGKNDPFYGWVSNDYEKVFEDIDGIVEVYKRIK